MAACPSSARRRSRRSHPSARSTSPAPRRASRPACGSACCSSPQRYLEPIAEAQHDLFLTCPPLMAELFKLWQGNGTAQRLAQRQRVEARARQDLARDILGNREYRTQPTSYHLWLPLPPPWRTSQFVAAAEGARRGGRSGLGVRGRPRPGAARGARLAQRREQPRAPRARAADPGAAARRAACPPSRGHLTRRLLGGPRRPAHPRAHRLSEPVLAVEGSRNAGDCGYGLLQLSRS